MLHAYLEESAAIARFSVNDEWIIRDKWSRYLANNIPAIIAHRCIRIAFRNRNIDPMRLWKSATLQPWHVLPASLRLHGTPCYNIRVLFAARVPLSSQVPNCDEIRHSDANGTGETAVETATWTTCLSFLDRRARGANYLRLVSHVVRSFVARRRPGAPANFGIKITGACRVILLCERSCRPTTHRAL